ncbi:dynamin family protein, partial [Bradyrhizobium sp.]|uniref:dynamin family protein n=1 Tax=Bradyrhizobium sp. TaxID=376 RepID=UPI003C328702
GLVRATGTHSDHETSASLPGFGASMMEPQRLTDGFDSPGSGRLIRIGLFGEFSAGKSSVANLLLGREVLPTAVLSSTRRSTVVRYAPELQIEAINHDGSREMVSPDAMAALSREDISRFDIGLPNPLLRHIELLDTAGFADPYQDNRRTLDVVDSVDICIWCTLATQAWRRSEQQTWLGLPARLRSSGILVATHADNLTRARDLQRVKARLQRETGELFASIVLLAVPDAIRGRGADDLIADPELWRASGGENLLAAIRHAVSNLVQLRRRDVGAARKTDERDEKQQAAPRGIEQELAAVAVDSGASQFRPALTANPPVAELGDPEAEALLSRVMTAVPLCLSAAWIDLRTRRVMHCSGLDAEDMAESPSLGAAISELFQGDNVQKIETLFRRARGRSADENHYFQEIVIVASDCLSIMLRSPSRADRALVVVTDKAASLGLVLTTTRRLLLSFAAPVA